MGARKVPTCRPLTYSLRPDLRGASRFGQVCSIEPRRDHRLPHLRPTDVENEHTEDETLASDNALVCGSCGFVVDPIEVSKAAAAAREIKGNAAGRRDAESSICTPSYRALV